MEIGSRTDLGRVRSNNEDNYKLVPELHLLVLSDGMGGEAHGEVASKIAVESIAAHCLEATENNSLPLCSALRPELATETNRLVSAVCVANKAIFEAAQKNPAQKGMGATTVAVWINEERLSLANVGDSRIYLLRAGELQQLTQDHSLVAEQVRRGILTPQQADQSDMNSVLIRALGIEEQVEVDADEHLLMKGDMVLLCSDGLSRMVPEAEIASTLLTYNGAQSAADRLVELANEYGGQDNITVVVLKVPARGDSFFARVWRFLTTPLW
jgi:protein phosphatase